MDDAAFRRRLPFPVLETNLAGVFARTDVAADDALRGTLERFRLSADLRVAPVFEVIPTRHTSLEAVASSKRRRRVTQGMRALPSMRTSWTSSLWSGCTTQGAWTTVEARWRIPVVSKPPEPAGDDGLWWMYSWVGLDGAGTNELLQVGIDQRVHQNGTTECNPWFEWVAPVMANSPAYVSYTRIQNLVVRPRDEVWCRVEYLRDGDKNFAGSIDLANLTTGEHTGFCVFPPPGTSLAGQTLDWIVECPGTGYPDFALAKFSEVNFVAASGAGTDASVGLPSTGIIWNIVDGHGSVETRVEIADPGGVDEDRVRIRHYDDTPLCQRLANLCQTIRSAGYRISER